MCILILIYIYWYFWIIWCHMSHLMVTCRMSHGTVALPTCEANPAAPLSQELKRKETEAEAVSRRCPCFDILKRDHFKPLPSTKLVKRPNLKFVLYFVVFVSPFSSVFCFVSRLVVAFWHLIRFSTDLKPWHGDGTAMEWRPCPMATMSSHCLCGLAWWKIFLRRCLDIWTSGHLKSIAIDIWQHIMDIWKLNSMRICRDITWICPRWAVPRRRRFLWRWYNLKEELSQRKSGHVQTWLLKFIDFHLLWGKKIFCDSISTSSGSRSPAAQSQDVFTGASLAWAKDESQRAPGRNELHTALHDRLSHLRWKWHRMPRRYILAQYDTRFITYNEHIMNISWTYHEHMNISHISIHLYSYLCHISHIWSPTP